MTIQPLDYFAVITDLIRCGIPITRIADDIGVQYRRIYRAYRGEQDLRLHDAEKLIALWCAKTRRSYLELPRVQV
jgi:hypothetical protein